MALGGVRDEAELRGHRRTYIGAMPGRLVRALRDAGTINPVIVLDEVDKLGADWRGDPSSALLEVLDPAQNHSFRDHYLDVELDLSKVMFVATANILDTIPPALRDRMEIIEFDGYTTDEKIQIALNHLWPRQLKRAGLEKDDVLISDEAIRQIITSYTREAGVRQLERELGRLLRKLARNYAVDHQTITITPQKAQEVLGKKRFRPETEILENAPPGIATGLAVTGTGGDVLQVEAAKSAGKEELILTGQLGKVMQESAQIALMYVKAHIANLNGASFQGQTVHVHVPAGAQRVMMWE
jgi:ATP-dependent Lon protease